MLGWLFALVLLDIVFNFIIWRTIMATLAEATADLVALNAQVERNRTEVLAAIEALENATPAETTPEFDAAMTNLKATVQQSDDDVVPPV